MNNDDKSDVIKSFQLNQDILIRQILMDKEHDAEGITRYGKIIKCRILEITEKTVYLKDIDKFNYLKKLSIKEKENTSDRFRVLKSEFFNHYELIEILVKKEPTADEKVEAMKEMVNTKKRVKPSEISRLFS